MLPADVPALAPPPVEEQAAKTTDALARSPAIRVSERLVDKLLPPVMSDERSKTP